MRSRTTRLRNNLPAWIESIRALLRPEFIEVSGKVFQVGHKAGAKQCRRSFSSKAPETVDENTSNHEHFWFFDGTTEDGVRRNYLLAEVVRLAWRDVLTQRFPEKQFRLFVSNEYYVDPDDSDRGEEIGVDTVLRLWSIDPETAETFDAVYHPDLVSVDKVLWLEFPERGLIPLREMLAVIEQAPDHPDYQEALQRRRRSHAI